MNSISYVSALLEDLKKQGASKEEIIRKVSRSTVGWPYVFGAWGEECTPAGRRKRKRDDHPTIVSACRVLNGSAKTCSGCPWHLPVRMFDCRGFVKWVFDQAGISIAGQGCNSQYSDKNNWESRGPIEKMPKNRICCVFTGTAPKKNHVGICLGDGTVIECSSGVQWTSRLLGKWMYYAVPKGLYENTVDSDQWTVVSSARPVLRLGAKGEAVREMQKLLLAAGERLPRYGADGSFGAETLAAVRSFQRKNGLIVDGVCGKNTWAKLDSAAASPK